MTWLGDEQGTACEPPSHFTAYDYVDTVAIVVGFVVATAVAERVLAYALWKVRK